MKVSEEFLSIQGEGLDLGVLTYFVRFPACDLRCRWCDTPYASLHPEAGEATTVEDVLSRAIESGAEWMCITGGEPLLFPEFVPLVQATPCSLKVDVQTAGHRLPSMGTGNVTRWSVSPKPPSAGEAACSATWAHIPEWLELHRQHPRVQFKIPVCDIVDLDFVQAQVEEYRLLYKVPVILQPVGPSEACDVALYATQSAGYDVGTLVREVACRSALRGIRIIPQVHKLLWGVRRGV